MPLLCLGSRIEQGCQLFQDESHLFRTETGASANGAFDNRREFEG